MNQVHGMTRQNNSKKGCEEVGMRQADSTIKGYLYQFNKSILETLRLPDEGSLILEGIIEDIDILSPTSTTTIQCKYHEDKRYTLSNVAVPIIEMLSNYCEISCIGKEIQYVLYSFYPDNVDNIEMADFQNYLKTTQDKDILVKYYHKIFNIPDSNILDIANKPKKSSIEKDRLISYYKANQSSLSLRINLNDFWSCFCYKKAENFDQLKKLVLEELKAISDETTASSLYYPNALAHIATLSSKRNENERTISKANLVDFLVQQRTVLLNQWSLEATDRKKLLKSKRDSLSSLFASNSDLRAFIFSDSFLADNKYTTILFIRKYIEKYYKKPKLQKPPIFVFDDNSEELMQSVILELYKYQQLVHTGMVGKQFVSDSFISNINCPPNHVCKITKLSNITVDILENCKVNQLFTIGNPITTLESKNYCIESLAISSMTELEYLVHLRNDLGGII